MDDLWHYTVSEIEKTSNTSNTQQNRAKVNSSFRKKLKNLNADGNLLYKEI